MRWRLPGKARQLFLPSTAKGRDIQESTLHRTARSIALCPLSGIPTVRVPRKGWRREDPSNGGDGAAGHNAGGGGSGKAGDDDATSDDTTGTGGKAPKIEGDFDAERAQNTIAAARQAEAKAKAEKRVADDRVAAVLKAAGLTPDGKTDPAEQLKEAAAARDTATAKARETAVELAVYKSAGKAGGDPDALLDSRGFLKAVAELDPDAADFGDKVTAAIKAAVKANAKLSATPAGQGPGKQGADHGGAGGGQQGKPKTLSEAIAAKLGG